MMQIWFLSNGSYSLKKCHNPFGKAIQPPPPYGKIPVEHGFSLRGASLTLCCTFMGAADCLFAEETIIVLWLYAERLDGVCVSVDLFSGCKSHTWHCERTHKLAAEA